MGLTDIFRKKVAPTMDMKVCMMGPRAVGKTTILTAIFNDTQESIGMHTDMHLTAESATAAELIDRQHMLNAIFAERRQISDRPDAGLAATNTVNTFDFHFGLKGKAPRINLEIKDFPGEFVQHKGEEVARFIDESTGIFIAIDTPHLMEDGGRYNEAKNRPALITDFFRKVVEKLNTEKLVLLVPLKCERYFNEGRMGEVAERVKTVYAELIALLRASRKVSCAVTPILTLGDVEYDDMQRNDCAEVVMNDFGTPARVDYRFCSPNAKYNPAFCVQPLYYLLSFLAAQYKRNRRSADFLSRLLGSLFDNDEPLLDAILAMEKNRRTTLPGYEVLCGADLFTYCK